jgi:sorbitol/mannitol transport system permease protein
MKTLTHSQQRNNWLLLSPSVTLLLLWMIVPLAMTIYFSLMRYSLLDADNIQFDGLQNYYYFLTDASFWNALKNTLLLVGSVLLITVIGGVGIAVLIDEPFFGRSAVRLMLIAPFFIMPTVSALIWKNLLMNPVSGIFAALWRSLGLTPIDWFAQAPMLAIIIMVAWQWLPFAILLLMTAMQSLDKDQKEAAMLDGAGPFALFFYLTLPHLARTIAVVVMIETLFLLAVFAEIYTTTSGGPGDATTNLVFLIYSQALLNFDVGMASAGGLIAVVLANIVAFILIRLLRKNLHTA